MFFLNCKFAFVFSRPLNKVLNVLTLGAFVTVPFLQRQSHLCSPRTLALLLGLLKLSAWWRTRAAKALLQHVGVCWLYPLVVILFCFNDLKAKLLVKIDGRLIVDLHVTGGDTGRHWFSEQNFTGVTIKLLF